MSGSKFVYVTYIRIPPEKLWHALTTPHRLRHPGPPHYDGNHGARVRHTGVSHRASLADWRGGRYCDPMRSCQEHSSLRLPVAFHTR